jgi:signal transduction histidine kinase
MLDTRTRGRPWLLAGLIVAVAALVFAVDLWGKQGLAIGVAYVGALALAFRSEQRRLAWIVAAACSVLVALGMFRPRENGDLELELANRALALFALWVSAFLCAIRREESRQADELKRSLEESLAERDKARVLQEQKTLALLTVVEDLRLERGRLAAEIEERRRAESALSASEDRLRGVNRELERFVEARTAELRASKERLDLALSSAGVGTWDWKIGEDSITWDDYMHPLFGMAPGTFGGTFEAFAVTLVPQERESVEQEIFRAVQDSADYDAEFRVVWPDHTIHVIAARGKVYRDEAGRPLRMTGVCWDVTERHRSEQALRRQARELTRSNRELEMFASVASHDLQEPLRMVASYTELLANRYADQLDEKARRWIGFAVEGTVRMKQLINDLLDFSRVGTRGKPFQSTDLNDVLRSVLLNLQTAIAECGAQIRHGPLPRVLGDATQLAQVLQNLIGNALKFRAKDKSPEIQLDADWQDGVWRISVRDNGIGIDPQFADRIFVIFQRLHSRDEYPGTGIGLAICKKIIERHGGHIGVESHPGEGTTFRFTLDARPQPCLTESEDDS